MSNLGLSLMGDAEGISILQTNVGDRYVLEKMLEEGYNLGGEQSGHVIFLDHNTTGDGVLTAIQLLSVMKRPCPPASRAQAALCRKYESARAHLWKIPPPKHESHHAQREYSYNHFSSRYLIRKWHFHFICFLFQTFWRKEGAHGMGECKKICHYSAGTAEPCARRAEFPPPLKRQRAAVSAIHTFVRTHRHSRFLAVKKQSFQRFLAVRRNLRQKTRHRSGNCWQFIILLVLLNLALGVLNFRQRQENTMTAAQERAIFEVLSQNSITLYTELPTYKVKMPLADNPQMA